MEVGQGGSLRRIKAQPSLRSVLFLLPSEHKHTLSFPYELSAPRLCWLRWSLEHAVTGTHFWPACETPAWLSSVLRLLSKVWSGLTQKCDYPLISVSMRTEERVLGVEVKFEQETQFEVLHAGACLSLNLRGKKLNDKLECVCCFFCVSCVRWNAAGMCMCAYAVNCSSFVDTGSVFKVSVARMAVLPQVRERCRKTLYSSPKQLQIQLDWIFHI